MDLTYLKPPREGDTTVVSLSASTASASQDVFGAASAETTCKVAICMDEDGYVTFGTDGAEPTDPNITATSGGGRTWPIARFTPTLFVCGGNDRYFKAISASATYLRWRIED